MKSLLESDSDCNGQSNLKGLEYESSTIQFWTTNRLSLVFFKQIEFDNLF